MKDFAKLFDTEQGQLLAFLSETDEGDPAVTVMGALASDEAPRVQIHMSGWRDGEAGQLTAFDKIGQPEAEELAAKLFKMGMGFPPQAKEGD